MRAGFAALLVAYVFSQFYRAFLAVLAPVLAADIGATPGDLAFASGVWFAAFAAMQLPVGHALDTHRAASHLRLALGPRRPRRRGFRRRQRPGRRHPGDGADRRRLLGGADGLVLHLRPRLPAGGLRQPRRPRDRRRLGRQRRQRRADGLGRRGRRLAGEPLGPRRRHARSPRSRCSRSSATRPAPSRRTAAASASASARCCAAPRFLLLVPLTLAHYAPVAGVRGLWAGPYLADVFGLDAVGIGNVTLAMGVAMIARQPRLRPARPAARHPQGRAARRQPHARRRAAHALGPPGRRARMRRWRCSAPSASSACRSR